MKNCNILKTDYTFYLLVIFTLMLTLLVGCSAHNQDSAEVLFDHRMQGNLYFHQGKYSASLQEYQAALRLTPDDWLTHYGYARTLEQVGRFQEAITEYRKVIAINYSTKNPADKALWHYRLAGVLAKQGLLRDARAEYNLTYEFASQDQTHSKNLAKLKTVSFYRK